MFTRLVGIGRILSARSSGVAIRLFLVGCIVLAYGHPVQAGRTIGIARPVLHEATRLTVGSPAPTRFTVSERNPDSSLLTGRGRSISLSDQLQGGLFPEIPDFQVGYLFDFGPRLRHSRLTLDYLIPVALSDTDLVFSLTHATIHDFGKTRLGDADTRFDLSSGIGYRKIIGTRFLVGVNVFRDTSRLSSSRCNSWSAGLETAAMVTGNTALDLSANYYGNLISDPDTVLNIFREGTGNYDVEIGYAVPFPSERGDLRVKLRGFRFYAGDSVYGWTAGATLTTSDGLLSLRYERTSDGLNGRYDSIGGYLNVGLDLEKLLSGRSPFTLPDPVFRSPRGSGRLLRRSLSRVWSLPSLLVADDTAP